jgi:hypothetical protein
MYVPFMWSECGVFIHQPFDYWLMRRCTSAGKGGGASRKDDIVIDSPFYCFTVCQVALIDCRASWCLLVVFADMLNVELRIPFLPALT